MDTVFRAGAIYLALLLIFRLTGKRSLAQITSFDFVLLLIISETTQQAMIGQDFSVTNALLGILTLVLLDFALGLLKRWRPRLDRYINGLPLVIVADGVPLRDRMAQARVDEDDVLTAARTTHGLMRMDQIRFAVLERSGGISIIPKEGSSS
jgi:uncharacterized membrane protein YcaP (DUF421 family)